MDLKLVNNNKVLFQFLFSSFQANARRPSSVLLKVEVEVEVDGRHLLAFNFQQKSLKLNSELKTQLKT
jgi:hypothetical protein